MFNKDKQMLPMEMGGKQQPFHVTIVSISVIIALFLRVKREGDMLFPR